VLAVHAALLPNGNVLYFSGSQHTFPQDRVQGPRGLDNTEVWNVVTQDVTRVHSPEPLFDLFCCGHAFLDDGRLLQAGGSSQYPPPDGAYHQGHYLGVRRASIFDVDGGNWTNVADMNEAPDNVRQGFQADQTGGRWYPTLVALPNGQVVALGGHPDAGDSRHSNFDVERFDAAAGALGRWVIVGQVPPDVQEVD